MEKTRREEVQRWTQEKHEERESRVKKKGAVAKGMDSETRGGKQEEGNRKRRKDARGESRKDVYTSIL